MHLQLVMNIAIVICSLHDHVMYMYNSEEVRHTFNVIHEISCKILVLQLQFLTKPQALCYKLTFRVIPLLFTSISATQPLMGLLTKQEYLLSLGIRPNHYGLVPIPSISC